MAVNDCEPRDWCESLRKACILGESGSGKTTLLAHRVAEALAQGRFGHAAARPEAPDALVFVASPQAKRSFEALLAQAMGISDAQLETLPLLVTTPRAYALEVLSAPPAQTFTGRRARLLLPFEENILLEDVKSSGVQPKRLREMLKFFRRSWTELADDDPTWLVSEEEVTVHSLLKECLAFTGGMLADEVSNLAVRWLLHDPQARQAAQTPWVFVDDYQLLSRASQVFCGTLAEEELVVAGDPTCAEQVFEDYPSAAGLLQFARADSVHLTHLGPSKSSPAVTACCDALAREITLFTGADEEEPRPDLAEKGTRPQVNSPGAPGIDGTACAYAFSSPEKEISHVAHEVQARIAQGCTPAGIFVAVPNRIWKHALTRSLEAGGITCACKPDDSPFRQDTRRLDCCDNARFLTLLCLAADPHDMVAWRSWCAFGDWLSESPGFAALRAVSTESGMEPLDVIANERASLGCASGLDAAQAQSLERISRAIKCGQGALARLKGLTGEELVQRAWQLAASGEPSPSQHAEQAADTPKPQGGHTNLLESLGIQIDVGQGAAELVGRILAACQEPNFPTDKEGVFIAALADAHGQSFDTVFISGFVNGFIPKHAYFDPTKTELDRMPRLHAQDVGRLYQTVGRARHSLLISSFTQIDASRAERLDLKIDRIFLKDGKRMARVAPSELLGAMSLSPMEGR